MSKSTRLGGGLIYGEVVENSTKEQNIQLKILLNNLLLGLESIQSDIKTF